MRWLAAVIVVASALTAAPASACLDPVLFCDGPDDGFPHVSREAKRAYYDGKFGVAAALAESPRTPETLLYAARARIAEAIVRDGGMCLECLVKAEEAANA